MIKVVPGWRPPFRQPVPGFQERREARLRKLPVRDCASGFRPALVAAVQRVEEATGSAGGSGSNTGQSTLSAAGDQDAVGPRIVNSQLEFAALVPYPPAPSSLQLFVLHTTASLAAPAAPRPTAEAVALVDHAAQSTPPNIWKRSGAASLKRSRSASRGTPHPSRRQGRQ